jgi:DNA invertase Pin-like site-specific DNA recombinase
MTYLYKPPSTLPRGSEVFAYMRDSGGPHQEDSIGQQERVIREYCKDNGLILSRTYTDTASGRSTKNRDQFLAMYHTIESMHEDLRPCGILLWAYSRFSRDIVDFNFYLYGLMKNKIIVHSITEEIPEGIAGQIMLSFTAYKNAGFSVELGKQIKRAIADRVKAGYCNGGQPPRGYIAVRDFAGLRRNGQQRTGVKWEPDPELAPLVLRAWELRAQGKSYAEITEATGGKIYKSKTVWVTHFRNESYLGTGKAGGERIENHHTPIITRELWDAVRRVEKALGHKSGSPLHHRRIKHPSLLSSLVFCIHCGAAMVLHTSADYRSYACGRRDRQRGAQDCTQAQRVNARKADRAILDAVLNRILSPAYVDDLVSEIEKQMTDTSKFDRAIDDAYILLDQTKLQINRLVKLAKDTDNLDEITRELRDLKIQESESSIQIKQLKDQRNREMPHITPEALALVFDAWRTQIENAYQTGDILNAKRLLAQFVKRIDLGRSTAIIHYTHPLEIPAEHAALMCAHTKYR